MNQHPLSAPPGPSRSASSETRRLSDSVPTGRSRQTCMLIWHGATTQRHYLLTSPPPLEDIQGDNASMVITTPSNRVTIRGEGLTYLVIAMARGEVGEIGPTELVPVADNQWRITSITIEPLGTE